MVFSLISPQAAWEAYLGYLMPDTMEDRAQNGTYGNGSLTGESNGLSLFSPAAAEENNKIRLLREARSGGWGRDRTADLWVMNPPL